jgi:hypothetical protein
MFFGYNMGANYYTMFFENNMEPVIIQCSLDIIWGLIIIQCSLEIIWSSLLYNVL